MNLPKFAKLAAVALCLLTSEINSQNIVVTGANVGNGTYATLGAAFTAINAGSQSGATIGIAVVGNTIEATTANLNSGTWNSITITPVGARSIIATTSLELFDFNGCDRVTVNGLNAGGNSLTFDNTNGGAVMWFENDAHNNVLKNLSINASNSYAPIVFWTGTVTGNDSITVDSCIIAPSLAGGNSWYGIYSAGTFGMDNSDITISNCSVSDWYTSTWHTGGIHLFNNNTRWTIQNNRLFQTAPRSYPNGYYHYGIDVSDGNGYVISGNIIGYASAVGTGVYTISSTSNAVYCAIFAGLDPGPASVIDGNVITALNMSVNTGTSALFGTMCGIYVSGGSADVGLLNGNTIGGGTINSMVLNTATNNGSTLNAIKVTGSGTFNIENNTIGGLTNETGTAANSGNLYGIDVVVSGSFAIGNNSIGNGNIDDMRCGISGFTTGASVGVGIAISSTQAANSSIEGNTISNISAYGSNTGSYVAGVYSNSSTTNPSALNISGNTVYDMKTNSTRTGSSFGHCSAIGINLSSGTNSTVIDNIVYNISNSNTGTINTVVAGITHSDGSNVTIARNSVYGIINAGTATSSTLPSISAGILVRSGSNEVRVQNNMVTIGSSTAGNSCFIGIMANHAAIPDPSLDRIYHNSVNVAGTSSGNQPSFCFLRGDMSSTARTISVDIRNNVFTNTRTGGTGVHYAIANNYNAAGNATGWTAGASNYNVLNTPAAGVGYWGGQRTFAQWQVTSSCDAQSLNAIAVNYVNAANNLHMIVATNPLIEQVGLPLPGVTDDFDSDPRSTCFVDLGADEFSDPHEIEISGNAVVISDGDISSSFTDHTTFDSTSVCTGSTSRSFTITNTGTDNLTISSVTVSGVNASDFTVTVSPSGVIGPLGTSVFTVVFDPSGAGIRAATISVISDDCDEATYDFVVSGTGSLISVASIASINPSCFGFTDGNATVNIYGGIAPIIYAWSSGGTSAVETGLGAGSYTVTVTDVNGCTAMSTVTLIEPAVLAIQGIVTSDVTTCAMNDGAIDITVVGGTSAYSYAWSNAATTEDLSGLSAGSYSCTVTDANGCTVTTSMIVIAAPTPPIVTYTEAIDSACQTTTNAFTLSFGSPSGGSWSGPGVNAGMFDPLLANVGWNVINYTYTDSVTLCSASAVDSIWVDLCMGTSLINSFQVDVSVYPNPTSGLFTVVLTSATFTEATIEILSVDGKSVYIEAMNNAGGSTKQVDMSGMANGTYFLHIRFAESQEVVKVIKAD